MAALSLLRTIWKGVLWASEQRPMANLPQALHYLRLDGFGITDLDLNRF